MRDPLIDHLGKPRDPATVHIHGTSWRGERRVMLSDFRRAVDAYKGGNQTAFGVEVMKCADGRQVRRWYAGHGMGWDHASRFLEWRKSAEGKAAMIGQRELAPATKPRAKRRAK